ncbi:holo-ACP synthase [Undibacterium terreum]|uniref:Holo-[acyl-carrier-protein] synthase n=1 Tax=Undibacterium terreum TaxID=1224302 RepID=A0A916XSA0_9BURK|nr:holo-ACP synthase [Undibacterium terreum]GGC98646.1 holo-[acyl-carrier-protein] synthase [Undibacterium terreum]
MIYGIGTDIIQISRIEAALARNGERFAEKILGVEELEKYRRRKAKVEARGIRFLATRFAAKEAFSKAIGMGMRMPMTWRAMQTLNAPSGQPIAVTSGSLLEWMTAQGLTARVSITDETDYAVAFVIVEKNVADLAR